MIRWAGVIKPGTVINNIAAHQDMMTTLLAAAGDTTVKEDLLKGRTLGDMTYKVHLDGYNLMPALQGQVEWPRHEFLYFTDDGNCAALRYDINPRSGNLKSLGVVTQPKKVLKKPGVVSGLFSI